MLVCGQVKDEGKKAFLLEVNLEEGASGLEVRS